MGLRLSGFINLSYSCTVQTKHMYSHFKCLKSWDFLNFTKRTQKHFNISIIVRSFFFYYLLSNPPWLCSGLPICMAPQKELKRVVTQEIYLLTFSVCSYLIRQLNMNFNRRDNSKSEQNKIISSESWLWDSEFLQQYSPIHCLLLKQDMELRSFLHVRC